MDDIKIPQKPTVEERVHQLEQRLAFLETFYNEFQFHVHGPDGSVAFYKRDQV